MRMKKWIFIFAGLFLLMGASVFLLDNWIMKQLAMEKDGFAKCDILDKKFNMSVSERNDYIVVNYIMLDGGRRAINHLAVYSLLSLYIPLWSDDRKSYYVKKICNIS